jgi:hypothetical protein
MFIAALFTIAKLWKQPRCPSTDKWIKKMWYLYTMEFYAAMKKMILFVLCSVARKTGTQHHDGPLIEMELTNFWNEFHCSWSDRCVHLAIS